MNEVSELEETQVGEGDEQSQARKKPGMFGLGTVTPQNSEKMTSKNGLTAPAASIVGDSAATASAKAMKRQL